MVDAVFEGGVFRPLTPVVDVAERARVRLTLEVPAPAPAPPPDGDARIAELERLAVATFDAFTPEEETALHAARLDQKHFFDRTAS